MFSDYALNEFSDKMRKIRSELGYSRQIVSKITGINVDTIRKIENGSCIPRFETLEILAQVYKVDLIQMLNNYKENSTLTYFYESINYYVTSNDLNSLHNLYHEFKIWNNMKSNTLINILELTQLECFFDAIIDSLDNTQEKNYKQTIFELIKALQITIPLFSLDNLKKFSFNALELRILYCIASFLLKNMEYTLSNDILLYLLDKVDIVVTTKINYKVMLIKLYALISYNFHMIDDHLKALEAAEIGIKICQDHNIMDSLALLLCRKGVAMKNLHIDNYSKYLEQAVILLEIQGNYELSEKYREINKRYGVI